MNSRLHQIFTSMTHNIDDDLSHLPESIKRLCNQYKVKVSWIFLAFISIFLFFTMIGVFQHFWVTIFGMIYPLYMSLFQNREQHTQQKQKQWTTYWVIFGLLTGFDFMINFFAFFLPAYYSFKTLFFLWLFYPRNNGATIIYEKFIKGYMKNLQQTIQGFKLQ